MPPISVIRKNQTFCTYFNFGCKYNSQIQIVAIFRKKNILENFQNGRADLEKSKF